MASIDIRTGAVTRNDTDFGTAVGDKYGQLVVVGGGGQYREAAYRGRVFSGANQGPGGTTTTVGLATTYTGLALSNPANSTVNLSLLHVGCSVVGAPVALSTIGLMAGYTAAGVVTHTTPLVANCTKWGLNAGVAQGKIDAAATLTNTPVVIHSFGTMPITGATAQVVNAPFTGISYDVNGAIVLQPGAHVALYTSTVLTVIASFMWEEIPA